MFTEFFYTLKRRKVPVSLTEWMTLMEALSRGYINSLDEFYFLARAILVKSEAYYDHYDLAFQEYFGGIQGPPEIAEQILAWLNDPLNRPPLDLAGMSLDDVALRKLLDELARRLAEQTGPHDGGSYWVGRGGTSPFGHSGAHPAGIRIGGEGGGGRAIQIAAERRFRNYRHDLTLDVRQIKLALKGLRQLSRTGAPDELDLEGTIKTTARNAGDIELVWRRQRRNAVRVLLLMDVGGSMEPYARLCSQLFSAAHSSSHFREFRYYYFHNCVYDNLYRDMERQEAVSTEHLLRTMETDCKLILVGDARMAPWELTERYGSINYYDRNDLPGIAWLQRLAAHFTHRVWLNPEEPRFWVAYTAQAIRQLFPMFPLSIEGIGQAVKRLVVREAAPLNQR